MARNFGIRSYKPEEVNYSCSCDRFGEYGQPWTIITHKMYKNIFLEAYGNPSTAEELSLELGVALPYMEDELEYLTEQTLLVKDGDKYETAFPIVSKQAQEKVWTFTVHHTIPLTKLLTKLVDDFSGMCEAHGIHYYGTHQSYEDAKWTLLMRALDSLTFSAAPEDMFNQGYTQRPNNGCWDIVGYQDANIPDIPWVGLHGCPREREDKPAVYFQQFKYKRDNICEKTPEYLSHDDALTLKALAEGKLDECELRCLDRLLTYGYVRKTEAGYAPAIIVFDGHTSEEYLAFFTDEEKESIKQTSEEIRKLLREAMDFSRKVISDDLPASIATNERQRIFACDSEAFDRRYVLEQALKDGWIVYDENTSPVIGAYMYL